ncbi:MAG: DUF441 domain-containing protein [Bacillota bacterium]|nr:DUF441 domain-containing protein [Bacillota bacterium]
MSAQAFILLVVMFVGAASRNGLLVRAAAILLAVVMLDIAPVLSLLEERGLELGILMLTVAVLTPLASGHTSIADLTHTFVSKEGACALIAGVAAAVLTAQGVNLLRSSPQVVVGLALGSIIGAAFLGGIPAGPLVAAGVAAVLIKMVSR